MALPTRVVTTTVYDSTGAVVPGAVVTAELNRLEVAAAAGYIVPRLLTFVADDFGVVAMDLWPNALGGTESKYKICFRTGKPPYKSLGEVYAAIPDNDCDLVDVSDAPVYPGQRSGLDGSVWHTGIGLPVPELGQRPDFYLNVDNGDYYEKIAVATWVLRGRLAGPAGPAGPPAEITQITYAEIAALIALYVSSGGLAGGLAVGNWYEITDYAMRHRFYNPVTPAWEYAVGDVEALRVFAISPTEIDEKTVKSVTHPTDTIHYQLGNGRWENNDGPNKGIIYYREDTEWAIIFLFDWRSSAYKTCFLGSAVNATVYEQVYSQDLPDTKVAVFPLFKPGATVAEVKVLSHYNQPGQGRKGPEIPALVLWADEVYKVDYDWGTDFTFLYCDGFGSRIRNSGFGCCTNIAVAMTGAVGIINRFTAADNCTVHGEADGISNFQVFCDATLDCTDIQDTMLLPGCPITRFHGPLVGVTAGPTIDGPGYLGPELIGDNLLLDPTKWYSSEDGYWDVDGFHFSSTGAPDTLTYIGPMDVNSAGYYLVSWERSDMTSATLAPTVGGTAVNPDAIGFDRMGHGHYRSFVSPVDGTAISFTGQNGAVLSRASLRRSGTYQAPKTVVAHDSTLTGEGTTSSPLGVVKSEIMTPYVPTDGSTTTHPYSTSNAFSCNVSALTSSHSFTTAVSGWPAAGNYAWMTLKITTGASVPTCTICGTVKVLTPNTNHIFEIITDDGGATQVVTLEKTY